MREFIRLTLLSGTPIVVRPANIACIIEPRREGSTYPKATGAAIVFVGEHDEDEPWLVQESIDEILKLVSGSEEAKP